MIKRPGKKKNPKAAKNKTEKTKKQAHLPRFVVLAGLAGLLAVLVTGALLQFLIISPHTQQLQQQQSRSTLETAGKIINHELRLLQQETQALAASRPIAEALLTKDHTLQKQLTLSATGAIGHALQIRIRPLGDYQQDRSGKAPMNYAAVDLQRRIERGQPAHPEFSKSDQQWSLQTAAPIHSGNRVIGTLLIHHDLQRINQALAAIPAQLGRLELTQQFSGSPSQTVIRQGQGDGQKLTIKTSNPFWQLRFTANTAFQVGAPDTMLIMGILTAGLVIVLIGTLLAAKFQYQAHRKDAAQLLAQVKAHLAHKKIDAPHFILPAFKNLSHSLLSILQSTPAPVASASRNSALSEAGATPEAQATTPAAEPEPQAEVSQGSMPPLPELLEANDEFSTPLFQDDEILDIEELNDDLLIEEVSEPEPPVMDSSSTPPPAEIFRAYDIRGIVDETLTQSGVEQIGQAIGSVIRERGDKQVVVGCDGRLSSPVLKQCLIHGLTRAGVNVTDLDQVPTPALYFATHALECPNGVMLTGSHNPANYNGLKVTIGGHPYAGEQLQKLYQRIQDQQFSHGQGQVQSQGINSSYQERILEDVVLARSLKVVVDCGNGVAGPIVEQLYADLGCEVIPLYCEVDGHFPNHHPDPSKPENLATLIDRVQSEGADLGLAFDGDGDRVGLVTNKGDIVWPDRLLMLLAKDVVTRNPGADVIFDVKCSRKLNGLISGYGGRPVMWKTGHSFVKAKMQETGALLAGEMSGHIFFKERWYGFDDGIYSGARLLEVIAGDLRSTDQIFAAFPEGHCTPEINISVPESDKFNIINRLVHDGEFDGGTLIDIDGVRVEYPDGWGLIRASNTTPVLVLRFEADSEEALERIKRLFQQELLKIAPTLAANF